VPRLLLALLLSAGGCAALPQADFAPSQALADTSGTRLGAALSKALAAHPGKAGVYPLGRGRDAFAARVLLARAAERSLDVQYYIFRTDVTGGLLLTALWEAAERGVRVRVLLDDSTTRGMDGAIAALDAHANIEVRLFNPFANRGFRLGEMVTDFSRINRRMHNKSFTADNQATIVGGRNIGDEYFGAESAVEFADLDALAIGAAVREVSASFDAYWNSASAFPAERLLPRLSAQDEADVRGRWSHIGRSNPYVEALRTTPLVQQLLAGRLPLEWAAARVVSDDPAKVLHPPERKDLHMTAQLDSVLGRPERELDLVSPYFVPTKAGTAALVALVQRGVSVRVLTNSLAATDVSAVHAGYAKYREDLLRGGVRLYELKPTARPEAGGGGSDASLHAKTFAVDRARIFIGSFNFDPRSARLNTEMGLVVESAALATRLSSALDGTLPRDAYEVRLADGSLVWLDGATRYTADPQTGFFKRLWIGLLSILPIEWLL
jgi:putative cardiolipin synthase